MKLAAIIFAFAVVALFAGWLADRCIGRPLADRLERELPPPVPTVAIRGYIVGEFNMFGQWNNQAKVFDLVDDRVVRTRTYKLAFASNAMYRECEKNDGMAVEIQAVRAGREDNEWFVVISMEVLP